MQGMGKSVLNLEQEEGRDSLSPVRWDERPPTDEDAFRELITQLRLKTSAFVVITYQALRSLWFVFLQAFRSVYRGTGQSVHGGVRRTRRRTQRPPSATRDPGRAALTGSGSDDHGGGVVASPQQPAERGRRYVQKRYRKHRQ